jgi:azurin
MKIRLVPFAFLAALLASACGRKDIDAPATVADAIGSSSSTATTAAATSNPTPSNTGTPAATAATPAAASSAAAAGKSKSESSGGRVIEVTGNDQMQFNVKTIEAKAGEQLKVVFTNVGSLPKEAMGHNWVLLKAGTDPMAFGAASMTARDKDYIGDSVKDQVIAHTRILGPKEKQEISFTAPAAGEYTYICSFPGHVALMKGTLVVK